MKKTHVLNAESVVGSVLGSHLRASSILASLTGINPAAQRREPHSLLNSTRSRRAQFSFRASQHWCHPSENLSFIDETNTLTLEYGDQSPSRSKLSTEREVVINESDTLPYDVEPSLVTDAVDFDTLPSLGTLQARDGARTNDSGTFGACEVGYWERHALSGPNESTLSMTSRGPSSARSTFFPVASRQVAVVLRTFEARLAPTIDLGTEPGLGESLLSIGARHRPLADAILSICFCDSSVDQRPPDILEDLVKDAPILERDSSSYEGLLAASLLSFKARVARRFNSTLSISRMILTTIQGQNHSASNLP